MIEWTDELKKQFRKSIFMAIYLLVIMPIIFFILPNVYITKELIISEQNDLMFYLLIIVAAIYPLVTPLIEKGQIKMYHINKSKSIKPKISIKFISKNRYDTPEKLCFSSFIVKASLIEMSYVLGLVIYLASGDLTRMLYFYPIGIAWSLVYFPTKSRCEKFLEKVSSNAIV